MQSIRHVIGGGGGANKRCMVLGRVCVFKLNPMLVHMMICTVGKLVSYASVLID